MIQSLQPLRDNPEDVPQFTPVQKEMLQARLNAGWLMTNGTIEYLRSKGHSEEFIFGYIAGMNSVCGLIDDWEIIAKESQLSE